jgi:NADPH2:quinone reductase
MKAIVCKALTGPADLVYEDVDDPVARKGQVVVGVKAAGVNFPDILVTEGKYQFQPPLPFTPGSEIAGVVEAVGEGVEGLAVGDRVCGFHLNGAFAEKIALGADQCAKLPDAVPFEVAAGLQMTYGTMIHALEDRAKLAEGESVLVLGAAGGIGTAAVELARVMGARTIVAAASTPEKVATAKGLGATDGIVYTEEDLKKRAKALTGGGADVVVDPVGGPFAEAALRATGWEGRYLVIGFAAGDIPKIPLNLVLLKGCQLVGVFWGSFAQREPARARAQLERVVGWVADGRLKPAVGHTYPLAEASRALADLAARKIHGKAILLP